MNRYWTVKGQSPYQLRRSAVLEARTSAITTGVKALGPIARDLVEFLAAGAGRLSEINPPSYAVSRVGSN